MRSLCPPICLILAHFQFFRLAPRMCVPGHSRRRLGPTGFHSRHQAGLREPPAWLRALPPCRQRRNRVGPSSQRRLPPRRPGPSTGRRRLAMPCPAAHLRSSGSVAGATGLARPNGGLTQLPTSSLALMGGGSRSRSGAVARRTGESATRRAMLVAAPPWPQAVALRAPWRDPRLRCGNGRAAASCHARASLEAPHTWAGLLHSNPARGRSLPARRSCSARCADRRSRCSRV